jgi:hypothetical protein
MLLLFQDVGTDFSVAPQNQIALEQIDIENVYLLCKDLPANPCRGIGAGGLCPP